MPADSSSLPPFQYNTLKDGEFRLIHLHPGAPEDDIVISVDVVPQKYTCAYFAVSYVWGSINRVYPIYAGYCTRQGDTGRVADEPSGQLLVTKNLRDLLLDLRRDEGWYRTLWIDSLCINQDDVDEKNAQVPQIKSFFSTAELTIVYLRKHDRLMGMAIYTICTLAEMSNRSKEELPKSLVNILPGQLKVDAADHNWGCAPWDVDGAWDALMAFFHLAWFHRVWIIQEVTVSRELTILIKPDTFLSWDILLKACQVVEDSNMHETDGARVHCQIPLRLERMRTSFWKYLAECTKPVGSIDHEIEDDYLQSHHFLWLQSSSRGCCASDPRDHVFALLGIAEGGGQKMPVADYSHSLVEVYVRLAWTWLMVLKKRPLTWLGCVNNSYDAADLPTWIPDWRCQWDGIPLVLGWRAAHLGASGLKKLEGCHIEFPELSTPMTLPLRVQIRGCRVLQIKAVEPLKASNPDSWQTARHAEHINEFPEPYPTTYLSYGSAFKEAVEPDQEKGFLFHEPRSESFWTFRYAGVKRPRPRPIFAMEMEGRKVVSITPVHIGHGDFEKHLPYTVNSGDGRGEDEPKYTQRSLYERVSVAYRFHATIPQDGLVRGRSWFISEDGFMGLAPKVTQPGDVVVHFFGGTTLYVLREKRREEGKTIWGFVGECFVLGLMNGEINQDMPDDVVEDFSLE